jgi:hypothetical protein
MGNCTFRSIWRTERITGRGGSQLENGSSETRTARVNLDPARSKLNPAAFLTPLIRSGRVPALSYYRRYARKFNRRVNTIPAMTLLSFFPRALTIMVASPNRSESQSWTRPFTGEVCYP